MTDEFPIVDRPNPSFDPKGKHRPHYVVSSIDKDGNRRETFEWLLNLNMAFSLAKTISANGGRDVCIIRTVFNGFVITHHKPSDGTLIDDMGLSDAIRRHEGD